MISNQKSQLIEEISQLLRSQYNLGKISSSDLHILYDIVKDINSFELLINLLNEVKNVS